MKAKKITVNFEIEWKDQTGRLSLLVKGVQFHSLYATVFLTPSADATRFGKVVPFLSFTPL